MRLAVILGVILVVVILITASTYVIFFTGEDESDDGENVVDDGNGNGDGDENGDGDDNGNGNGDGDDDVEFVHQVFIEEGTATRCEYCPNVGSILDELYNSGDYHFYHLSLVEDMNDKASERLKEDYNNEGQPTVFIDGGYEVIKGGLNEKSVYAQAIRDAESRATPNIQITVKGEYDNITNELNAVAYIENKENNTYSGHLRVYIVEKNSPRWSDWNGNPYKYAFLDYAINKDVEIASDENKTFSGKWSITDSGFSNIYPQNLMLVAVVFNSESKQGYSNPEDSSGPFDAYYADDADASEVAEGTLPPAIGISFPKKGQRYIFGREKPRKLSSNTLIIGRITIQLNVEAESGIDRVEFMVTGGLRGKTINETLYEEPYEWTWKNPAWGTWTITVKVYDTEGRTASDSMEVKAYMYGFPILNRILSR